MSSLAGKHIVITRPEHQAIQIKKYLDQQQANVSLFPLITIQAIERQNLSHAREADWFIFISANAVEYGLKHLNLAKIDLSKKFVAAIGKKTASKLKQAGLTIDLVPEDTFNTECFLKLNATQSVEGKRILIFRGNGGREQLANVLRERGAKVEYAEVYRRSCPKQNTDTLKSRWQQQLLDIIVITSSEGLHNLYSMSKGDWIKSVPLLLGSERMRETAANLGHIGKIIMAKNPSDEAVLSQLLTWSKQESN